MDKKAARHPLQLLHQVIDTVALPVIIEMRRERLLDCPDPTAAGNRDARPR
jgi:hypothetical protein